MFTTYTTYGLALMKRQRKFSRKTTPKETVFVIVNLNVAFHPQPTSPPIVKYSNRLVQVLVNREILGSVGMVLVFKKHLTYPKSAIVYKRNSITIVNL